MPFTMAASQHPRSGARDHVPVRLGEERGAPIVLNKQGRTSVSNHLIHRVNVGDLVTRSAHRFPDREMICDGDRRWSYREFDAWTNRVAHGLSALGLKKGDALALMSGNRAEFLAVY